MRQNIYVDILLAVNFIIDYFLLRLTALLTGQHISGKRLVYTAVLASLTSLMIFAPAMPAWLNVLIDLILSTLISLICFGYGSEYHFLLRTVTFYIINLIYAGGILLFCFTCRPKNIVFCHGALYVPMPPILLILLAAALYFCVKLFDLSLKNGRIIEKNSAVVLTQGGAAIRLKGYTDTGNHAYDLYTGKPVIFCTANALEPLIGADGIEWFRNRKWLTEANHPPADLRLRLLPLRFAGGEDVLPVFLPEKLETETGHGKRISIDAAVAVVSHPFREGYDVLLHPEIPSAAPDISSSAERQGIK